MLSGISKLLVFVLAAALAAPCAAAPELSADVSISTAAAKKPEPIEFKFGYRKPDGPRERGSIGVGGGLSEGKPLEMLVWGSGGAIAGSLAGPPGVIIGAAVGALSGLVVGCVYRPKKKDRRGDP